MLLKYAEIGGRGCQLATGGDTMSAYICVLWARAITMVTRNASDILGVVFKEYWFTCVRLCSYRTFTGKLHVLFGLVYFFLCVYSSLPFFCEKSLSQTITSLLFRFSRWLKRTLEVFKRFEGGVLNKKLKKHEIKTSLDVWECKRLPLWVFEYFIPKIPGSSYYSRIFWFSFILKKMVLEN